MCPTMYQRKKIKAMCNNEIVQDYVYVRVDEVGKSKFIENFESYCGFNEDEFIATEIKNFKTIEHPEFYL